MDMFQGRHCFATHYYKDGSSSDPIYPKNGKYFEKFELAGKNSKIVFTEIFEPKPFPTKITKG